MKKKHFYAAVILVLFLAMGIQPAFAIKYIYDDATGGDATTIGNWDSSAKKCTLTQDVYETIQIMDDEITLDGGGFEISGVSGVDGAVKVDGTVKLDGNGIWNVNIQNLTITDCDVGINLIDCVVINVTNNSVTNFQEGIRLIGARTCIIEGNIVSGDVISNNGIVLGTITPVSIKRDSIGNELYNNTIENNSYGIYIWGLSYSTAKNQIFNNNFINNTVANAKVESGCHPEVNVFNGNYWDDWDGVTIPYTFPGGQDDLPWVIPNGWSNQSPVADAGPDQIVDQDSESPDGAWITLDGSGTSDDPIQTLTYTWSWADGGSSTGVMPTVTLPLGTTEVTLTVYDGVLSDTDTVDITVQNVDPPEDAPEDVVAGIIDYIVEDMYVPEDAEKEIGKAVKELNKAIDEFNKDRIDKAIKKIAKAVKELEKAQTKGADTQGVIDDLVDLVQGL